MLHIPILRSGRPYESVETTEIVHHATGEPVARLSLANGGMIVRDIQRMRHDVLEAFTVAELVARCKRAGELFMTASLPIGDQAQSFDDYVRDLSATTGMPVTYCRTNAAKIHRVFAEIDRVVAGLTRGFDLRILDDGYGEDGGRMLSFHRRANVLGAVLPSNSPGVHSLWIPAIALKTPLVLKPGREEPWTPYRIIQAFIAAGIPADAFGFYPTDHAGAAELLRAADRSMLFGADATTRPYASDPRVELHGPGYSKVILGDDAAHEWQQHLDVMVSSILANGGRSCINASGIWTPRNGRAIAEAIAGRLAGVQALPADDSAAEVAAFANPQMAEAISQSIDQHLAGPAAVDLTEQIRGSPRLVRKGRLAWLLPTIIWIEPRSTDARLGESASWEHPLANKEYLFPFASVVECPQAQIPEAIGSTLVASVITKNQAFIDAVVASPNVDRLNIGPIPTYQLSWDQPHEGNLFEHLYRRRAFQIEPAA